MTPFRLVIVVGCVLALTGAGYLSYYGIGRESRDLAPSVASIRTGSPGGGYGVVGWIK